jgi:agmatinase
LKLIPQLMTLPGAGVHTVHTAKEKKEKLFKAYYGTKNFDLAHSKWLSSLNKLKTNKPWIIGIPSDNGGGIHRGANWGPLAIREELLEEKSQFHDVGDIRVIPHLLHDKYLNQETIKRCQKALYGKVNKLPVSPLSMAEKALDSIYKTHPEVHLLGLGGDHSTSYPLFLSWLKSRKNLKQAALLHFDAHTDLLDSRLGIDLCFGTWTYQILDHLASPEHIIQIGIRSSGKDKKYWKEKLGVTQIWSKDVNSKGIEKTLDQILSHYKKIGVKELYISFDIDALDEKFAAATGTPEKFGLLPTDCAALIRLISKEIKITGADLMEVAPHVWPAGIEARDQKSSVTVAGDMAKVLLEALAK